MQLLLISDTHGFHSQLNMPPADVLVCCGDVCNGGTTEELHRFIVWLGSIANKYQYVLFVPGNHDKILTNELAVKKALLDVPNLVILVDKGVTIDDKTFYGTPWVPPCGPWAFCANSVVLDSLFLSIPGGLDVLITHGPPRGILDLVPGKNEQCGSEELLRAVRRAKPRYHVFGHIHESVGFQVSGGTTFVNCCVVGAPRTNVINGFKLLTI